MLRTSGIVHNNVGPPPAKISLGLVIHVPIWAPSTGGSSAKGVRDAVRIGFVEHIIHGDWRGPGLRVQNFSRTVVGFVEF